VSVGIQIALETDVPIPARSVVKFKAGKEMAAEVLKLPPQARILITRRLDCSAIDSGHWRAPAAPFSFY
jgi:hypothetical protein